jgi:replication factor A1
LKINELRDGMRKVDIEGNVIEKSDAREVRSRWTNETYKVADATLEDETGTITLTLWNEQVSQVNVGDRVKIENGYIKSFRDVLQLNSGKYGTLTVLKKDKKTFNLNSFL